MSDSKKMRTTTLEIEKPVNFNVLENAFRLVYYRLPLAYVKASKKSKKYEKLHVQMKNQLHQPYKTFDYAMINEEVAPVVYVLYRKSEDKALNEEPKELKWSTQKMQPIDIGFGSIPFHVLIKLLQADYFRGNRIGTFVSQGDFFILATQGREGSGAKCLLIDVKGDRHNTEESATQIFQVTGSVRKFIRIKDPKNPKQLQKDSEITTPYFRREMRPTGGVFSQIKAKELAEFIEAGRSVFKIYRKKNKKPNLPYHDQMNLFICRGGILYTFIENFCAYLGEKGLITKPKFRALTRFKTYPGYENLPISMLQKIHVFDNRVVKDQQQLDSFITFFTSWLKDHDYQIELENVTAISKKSRTPTLLLQDHVAKDFAKGGAFFEQGVIDPKLSIYADSSLKNIPKQSLNIAAAVDDNARKLRIQVALNQLLLKDVIIKARNISGVLPGFPAMQGKPNQLSLFPDLDPTPLREYAFLRRKTYNRKSVTTLVYLQDNHLEFVDVSENWELLYQLCERMGLIWDDIYLKLHEINFRTKNGIIDEGRELKRFDLILRQDQAIVIEDINEVVLYEYEEMNTRQRRLEESMSLDQFRLTHRLTPKNDTQKEQFKNFDSLLDELAEELSFPAISFRELTDGELGERIGEIFNLPKNDKNRFKFGNFKKFFQQPDLELFLSDKATSLHTYQGIWYDSECRYLVGEPDGIKQKQATANLVRQFTVLLGRTDIDIKPLLSTTGVQFIRPKRYTVYPYFFNLIEMYVNTR